MQRLGFLAEFSVNDENEEKLLQDMWRILGGETRNHVTLNNLRIILLAIMGTFIEPSLKKEEQKLEIISENSFGRFNEHGDLFLEQYEVPRLTKHFQSLNMNRV